MGGVVVAQIGIAAGGGARRRAGEALNKRGALQLPRLIDRNRSYGRIELMPRAAKPTEELDRLCVTTSDVRCELLEQTKGPAPAPVINGLGDVEPLRPRVQAGNEPRRQEIADVGDDPVVAG